MVQALPIGLRHAVQATRLIAVIALFSKFKDGVPTNWRTFLEALRRFAQLADAFVPLLNQTGLATAVARDSVAIVARFSDFSNVVAANRVGSETN